MGEKEERWKTPYHIKLNPKSNIIYLDLVLNTACYHGFGKGDFLGKIPACIYLQNIENLS